MNYASRPPHLNYEDARNTVRNNNLHNRLFSKKAHFDQTAILDAEFPTIKNAFEDARILPFVEGHERFDAIPKYAIAIFYRMLFDMNGLRYCLLSASKDSSNIDPRAEALQVRRKLSESPIREKAKRRLSQFVSENQSYLPEWIQNFDFNSNSDNDYVKIYQWADRLSMFRDRLRDWETLLFKHYVEKGPKRSRQLAYEIIQFVILIHPEFSQFDPKEILRKSYDRFRHDDPQKRTPDYKYLRNPTYDIFKATKEARIYDELKFPHRGNSLSEKNQAFSKSKVSHRPRSAKKTYAISPKFKTNR